MESPRRKNYRADKFESIGVSHLRRDVLLPNNKKISFLVWGKFLSILAASSDRFIDFDQESDSALEKVIQGKLPSGVDLCYFDSIGFDDPSKYQSY